MASFRVFLKKTKSEDFDGFSQVKTIEAKDEADAKEKAKKLETGGWKIYKIEKSS
ncbi:MAG: hypothetical protein ACTSQY_11535 [Candidatus Odinarchaeia archaeon]